MKLGIIGAENSHTAAIAKLFNIEKLVKGISVTHVWGETDEFAQKAAQAGNIPNVVKRPSDMIGHVDCIMIDHRDGQHHLKPAREMVAAGLPVFVDKPLCRSLAQAKAFLKFRAQKKVAVTTFSTLPYQQSAAEMLRQFKSVGTVKAVHFSGPGDYKSVYGGIWFYGIHQVDLLVSLIGPPKSVEMSINGKDCTAVCNYDGLTATMTFIAEGTWTFNCTIIGTDATWHSKLTMDASPYLAGARMFTRMFQTGKEPLADSRMLQPVALLEAMEKSLAGGKPVNVAKV